MAKSARKPKKAAGSSTGNPVGNPVTFSPDVAAAIMLAYSNGISLRAACEPHGVPRTTFLQWVEDDRDGIADKFLRAKKIAASTLADDCLEIADDGRNDWTETDRGVQLNSEHVRRSELRIGLRKWLAEKYNSEMYGPRGVGSSAPTSININFAPGDDSAL